MLQFIFLSLGEQHLEFAIGVTSYHVLVLYSDYKWKNIPIVGSSRAYKRNVVIPFMVKAHSFICNSFPFFHSMISRRKDGFKNDIACQLVVAVSA